MWYLGLSMDWGTGGVVGPGWLLYPTGVWNCSMSGKKKRWPGSRMGIKVEALNLNRVHRWLIIRPQLSNLRRPWLDHIKGRDPFVRA
jgi:hypothetical protein